MSDMTIAALFAVGLILIGGSYATLTLRHGGTVVELEPVDTPEE